MSAETVEPQDLGTGLDVTVTRSLSALALHLAGASDPQISRQLGFTSPAQARAAWEQCLADTVTTDDKNKVRRTEAARLDRLQAAWWNKAIDPSSAEQATAGRMIMSIMERRSRMLGLDAPTRMEVYTPTSQEIMAFVETLRASAGISDEAEPDIVEVDSYEVLPDEQAS
jgi:hypothetical protein